MKDVGVREFRDHASRYLSGDGPLAVRSHGRVLGFYFPVRRKSDTEELQVALRDAKDGLADLRSREWPLRRGAGRGTRA
jgi:hypothetical protein